MPVRLIEALGSATLSAGHTFMNTVEELGRASRIGFMGLANAVMPPFRLRLIAKQIDFIGVQSLPIILLAAIFTGAVFSLQSFRAFATFGAQGMVGGTVGVAVTRELAPTLTGLLVSGRAGSAIAAEIGSMRVTEQIDALEAMAVDPVSYLIKPRMIAALIAMPALTAVFDLAAIGASYLVSLYMLGLSEPEFVVRLQDWVDWRDVWSGLFKGLVFGLIMGTVACYKGYYTKGGASGVGVATTTSVVVSSVVILIANFFIAWALP